MKKEKAIWIKSREYIDAVGISRQRLSQLIHGVYMPNGYFIKPRFRERIDYKWVGKRLFVNQKLVGKKKRDKEAVPLKFSPAAYRRMRWND